MVLENIGVLAALGAMLCWGIGDFCIQKTTRKIGNIEALFFVGLFGGVVLFPFVLGDIPVFFSDPGVVLAFIVLSVFDFFIAVANFQAYKVGKISVVDPILVFELPITIALAIVIFQEQLTVVQALLSALLFFGVILVSISNHGFKSRHFLEKGALLAIMTAIGFGFINFFTGSFSRDTSPLFTIWFLWGSVAFYCFLYLLCKGRLRKMVRDAKKERKIVFAESFFDTFAWLLYAVALVQLPISLATGIVESYPALAILLGIFVNREVVKKHQYAGMAMALGSSFILALLV